MRRTPTHRLPLLTAAVLAAGLAGACASANKRLEQGMQLEQQGRAADAAERYIQALKKDRSLVDARQRLQQTGDQAMGDFLREADADAQAGRYADAADALGHLDGLRADAAGVGVQLTVPADYATRRRDLFDRAADQAVSMANAAVQARNYTEAVRWLDRAGRQWEPGPELRGRLDRVRYDALFGWADSEMQAGRYRSAFDRAGQAAALSGYDDGRAASLQREALRRGTVRVAVFPVGTVQGTRNKLPDDVLPALNRSLSDQYWSRPPQWLDVIDESSRGGGYGRGAIEPSNAASIGQRMGARLVVVMALDSVRQTEGDVVTQRRTAKTRSGADTAYTVREGRMETWARVSWRIVDAAGWGSALDQGTATARSTADFRSASYNGDWRTLQLPASDRELFDEGDRGYNRETVRELVSGLEGELGREVYDALLRRIP
jgi:tetratricopeptide (TPR) repeat protein